MAEGNDNKQSAPESGEIPPLSESSLWFHTPFSSSIGETEGHHYSDIFNVLSNVELLSPPPVSKEENLPGFHKGESSGTKRKSDDQTSQTHSEGIDQGEREQKRRLDDQQHPRRTRSSEVHNLMERRRRGRIKERLTALQELVPNCNKSDKASMLGDAIDYIKFLQQQVEMMKSMGLGVMPQAPYMSPVGHQSIQVPYFSPFVPMRPVMGMGYGMGMYGPGYSTGFPIFPALLPGFHTPLPSAETAGLPSVGESGLLPVPQLQLPFHSSQPYPATLTSPTIMSTSSQILPGIAADFYQTPGTSLRPLWGSTATVQASHIVRPSSSIIFEEHPTVEKEAQNSDHDQL